MKLAKVGKAFLCIAYVTALSSCGESEQPAIDILTPAAAPQGQNLLDCANIYNHWVGNWQVVAEEQNNAIISSVDWRDSYFYTFFADGSFEVKRVDGTVAERGAFALTNDFEFTLAERDGNFRTGTWMTSRDYLILHRTARSQRTGITWHTILILKRM